MQVLRGSPSAPVSRSGRWWSSTARSPRLPPAQIAAEAVAAELERLDRGWSRPEPRGRGRRGRGPAAARPAVRRHPRRPRPDDRRPDPAPRRPARVEHERIAAEHAVSEVLDGHAARLEAWPTRTWPPAPPTSATSRRGSSASCSASGRRRPWTTLAGPAGGPGARPLAERDGGARPARVLGFATEAGGRASHTAIVAAALEIPAVVGLGRFLDRARALPDGHHRRRRGAGRPRPRRGDAGALSPGGRRAGRPVPGAWPAWPTCPPRRSTAAVGLWGNIEFPGEVAACLDRGPAGRRPVPDRVPLPRLRSAADRAKSSSSRRTRPSSARCGAARSRSGPSTWGPTSWPPTGPRLRRAQPGAGAAEPAALAPRPGLVPDPAPRDPPGQRPGRRPDHVPAGPTLGEFRQARAILDDVAAELAAEGSRSRPTCRSASWSRCPPPP